MFFWPECGLFSSSSLRSSSLRVSSASCFSNMDCCCFYFYFLENFWMLPHKLRLQEITISKQLKLVIGFQEISTSPVTLCRNIAEAEWCQYWLSWPTVMRNCHPVNSANIRQALKCFPWWCRRVDWRPCTWEASAPSLNYTLAAIWSLRTSSEL